MSKTTARKGHENGAQATGHVAEKAALNPAVDFNYMACANRPLSLACIMNTMRVLKQVNRGDAYYENYQSMIKRYGEDFFDTYQVLWAIGVYRQPKRILEIGTRTGISLCQLLSSYIDHAIIEKIVCVDPFDQWTGPNIVMANLHYLNLPFVTKTKNGALQNDERLTIYIAKSEDVIPRLAENNDTFDFILVDGDHSKPAARRDLEGVAPLCEKGGVIVFDDISTAPGECALLDMWEDFKNAHQDEFYFFERLEGKGVGWAIKK